MSNSIVCLQETWALNQTKIDNCIYTLNKKIFSRSAKKDSDQGRPSGGIAFIVDKELKCTFIDLDERVNVLIVGNLAIINVYLTYFDASDRNKFEYTSQIELLSQTVQSQFNKGNEIVILGDFNTDPMKEN
ncbi:unnamed protein product [Brachionus calyciflorus]|uniref:Endonuclease/exonuclease/phosphatase domain-containing protein n=1 Tax=Brachionus calyciflorus TaxID=104777 RepID=A0A813UZY8_9BILA|nr:unnamed protein product [Brachionus calyciflorus]